MPSFNSFSFFLFRFSNKKTNIKYFVSGNKIFAFISFRDVDTVNKMVANIQFYLMNIVKWECECRQQSNDKKVASKNAKQTNNDKNYKNMMKIKF